MLAAVAVLPSGPGVYRFRDQAGRAIYIGRAADLRARVASYWGDLADRRHLRRMVPQVARIEALACASRHEAAWLERNLLERSKPRWNRVRGGLEVPAYIRLVNRRASARLDVVHSPVTSQDDAATVGPFLGGTRTRLAVDGLNRVLCLDYTADDLGGFDRDMARVRGVSPADRAERVRIAAAVLARDPAALSLVTDLLALRRTDAASALAFEVAARISEEMAALSWVASEQRVTVPGAGDATIHGWADGVLVSLEQRDGRIDRWTQRSCSESAAARLLPLTPPAWLAFATDAARLASALRDDRRPAGSGAS